MRWRLLLKGKDKKLVAAGTGPIVSDGAKGAPARRGKAGSDVVTKDGRTELVVRPDRKFLDDAGTTYPVRVAAAVTLPLSADVDVSTLDSDVSPAYPDNQYMLAGTMAGGTKARVHLRFDTAGLQGSTVTDATLSLNTIDSHNCGAALARGIQVARLTAGWDPDNPYWANKPAFTTEDASTSFKGVNSDCAVYPDSMDWNVTGIAQDWAAFRSGGYWARNCPRPSPAPCDPALTRRGHTVAPDSSQDLPAENQWDLLAEYGHGLENAFHALWVEASDPEEVAALFGVDPESRVERGLDTLGTSVYRGYPEVGIWIGPHAPGWTHLFAFNLYSHPLGLPNLGKRRVFEIDYTGEVGPGLSPLHLYYDGELLGDVTPPQEPGEPVDLPEYQPLTEGLELGGHDTYDEDVHSYFCMMGRVTSRFTDREWWRGTRTFYRIPGSVQ